MSESLPENRANLVYQSCCEWLRFAELKNSALVTANAALTLMFFQIYEWRGFAGTNNEYFLWISTAFLLVGGVVSFSSFFAKTKTSAFQENDTKHKGTPNPMFYGHIANMTVDQLVNEFLAGSSEKVSGAWLFHIAHQSIIVSQIAVSKYAKFNAALMFSLLGILTFAAYLAFPALNLLMRIIGQ